MCSISDYVGMHSLVGNSSVARLVPLHCFYRASNSFLPRYLFLDQFWAFKTGFTKALNNDLQSAGSTYLCFFQAPFDCIVREARCLPAPILLPPMNSKPRSVLLKPTFPKCSIGIKLRPSFRLHNFPGQYPRMTAASVREKSMESREQKKPW